MGIRRTRFRGLLQRAHTRLRPVDNAIGGPPGGQPATRWYGGQSDWSSGSRGASDRHPRPRPSGVSDTEATVDYRGEAVEHCRLVGQAIDHFKQVVLGEPGQERRCLGFVEVEAAADALLGVISAATGNHAGGDLVDRDIEVDCNVQRRASLGQESLQRGGQSPGGLVTPAGRVSFRNFPVRLPWPSTSI